MTKPLELEGEVFTYLTVVSKADSINGNSMWNCVCICGNKVVVSGTSLIRHHTKSCGCWNNKRIGDLNRTHGHASKTKTKTYNSWRGMIERCYNPNNKRYSRYGGRGISVCDRWRNSFENFLEDMGERPEGMTLDRKNANGDYNPENCKWADYGEQAYNIGIRSNNTSGRTGVTRHRDGVRWVASIKHKNKTYYLGIHDTFEEACSARAKAELFYYGNTKE